MLVAAIFAVALAALLLVQRTQRRSLAALLASETTERSTMLGRLVELTGQSLRDFTYDYAQWDDMVTFVANPKPEWAAINIDASLSNFNLSAAWVLRNDGSVVHATRGPRTAEPPLLPLSNVDLRRVLAAGEARSFFVQPADGLLEICFSPVRPSVDTERKTEARGWLVAARRWDEPVQRLIAEVIQCELRVAIPGAQPPAPQADEISLLHALPGIDGKPAAHLRYTIRSNELAIVSRDQRIELWLFAALYVAGLSAAVYYVFHWIVQPVQIVGESLETSNPAPIAPLLARGDELGRVAQAVQTSFDQRAELEKLIEDRIRLGRELHDGVIQTVFAAGMNLAGARAAVRQQPAEAERILDDTRRELNVTIRSLRDFIHGLEPEPHGQQSLREAMQSIVNLMQGVRAIEVTWEIDDALASTLSAAQRLHLLQITREAVSNSVRHGDSPRLVLRLARNGEGWTFEVTEEGGVFEQAPTAAGGHGLGNLAARARELGGELKLTAAPRGGVHVRLYVPARPAQD
jgi:signal transduction histidine kinase